MRFVRELSVKNLKRRPARTAALILLSAFLSFSIMGGSLMIISLQNGLASYEARLGADIVVVPNEARTKDTLDSILLQGIPGYFYMDIALLEKISEINGVETASPQFYLASSTSGCCSTAVQIIGFDPATDFSVQPWIRKNYGDSLGDGDLIVGSAITIPTDYTLTFYNTTCNVVAQLDETGTGLDTSIYANMNTIKAMMANAQALGFHYFDDVDADRAISSVMIEVAEGYSIEAVTDDINIHVRRVTATQSQSMISSIAGGLSGVSGMIGMLIVLFWILAVVILLIAFSMIMNERTREFAVLRVIGASQRMLARMLQLESVIISLIGAVIGAVSGGLVMLSFSSLMRSWLELPYLLPGMTVTIALMIGAIFAAVLAGWLTSSFAARRISKNETGLILRDDA